MTQLLKDLTKPKARLRKKVPNLSWSRIGLFLDCKRCFYKEYCYEKLGRPRSPSSAAINKAVDTLLKKEFGTYRNMQKPHPIIIEHDIKALPYNDDNFKQWCNARKKNGGIKLEYGNLHLIGEVDDIWVTSENELILVEYKATSKDPTSLTLHEIYKKQISFYAWLLKQKGFSVYPESYFIFCNGLKNKDSFNNSLEFDVKLLPYRLDDVWVAKTLDEIIVLLSNQILPIASPECEFCAYVAMSF